MALLDPKIEPVRAAAGRVHGGGPARTAIILAAGSGERMQGHQQRAKPLLELDGLLLIERAILCLGQAGVERFRVVVGTNALEIGAALRSRPRLLGLDIALVRCPDARLGNGHSLAAGAAGLGEPFLLSMSDHVFDPAIARRLQAKGAADRSRIQLATDAGLGGVFDLPDATKVRVEGDAIRAIGKELPSYTRADVGLFYCPGWVSELAAQAVAAGAHSVSQVMQRAIDEDALRSCPIEPLFWQDVDTPAMLDEARRRLRAAGDPLRLKGAGRLRQAGLLLALALLVWVVARQPFADIVAAVRPLRWSALALLGVPLLWYACNTLVLWLMVRRRVTVRALFLNQVAGDGLNLLLPLAGFGGEPWKARHLGRWLPAPEAAALVMTTRLIEEFTGVTFAGLCLLVSGRALPWPAWLQAASTSLGIALAVLGLALSLLLTGRVPGWLATTVRRVMRRSPDETVVAPLGSARILGAFALGLVGRAAGLLEVVVLLRILGVASGAEAAAGVSALLLLSGLATLIFPQGLGALEAASVFALGLLGEPAALGVAFGLLRRGRMVFYGVVGSALGLLVSRREARS
jgi:1L-myo-inositol 1-phosphate cytidylyltransferase